MWDDNDFVIPWTGSFEQGEELFESVNVGPYSGNRWRIVGNELGASMVKPRARSNSPSKCALG
jgi:hypothetical protein